MYVVPIKIKVSGKDKIIKYKLKNWVQYNLETSVKIIYLYFNKF